MHSGIHIEAGRLKPRTMQSLDVTAVAWISRAPTQVAVLATGDRDEADSGWYSRGTDDWHPRGWPSRNV
jgi:hypothetical protein